MSSDPDLKIKNPQRFPAPQHNQTVFNSQLSVDLSKPAIPRQDARFVKCYMLYVPLNPLFQSSPPKNLYFLGYIAIF